VDGRGIWIERLARCRTAWGRASPPGFLASADSKGVRVVSFVRAIIYLTQERKRTSVLLWEGTVFNAR
jgi:hypothetical protein